MNKQLSFAALASTAVLLAACGGDGHNDDGPRSQDLTVPAAASQGTGGLISYITMLVESSADLLEPVDITGFNPQTSELEEPAAT